jgi:outer membrane protein
MRYTYWTKFATGALVLLAASAAWGQGGAGSAPAGAMKIGLLNVRGAIVATAEGKQASAQMQSQFAPQQSELENLQKQIQDLQAQLANGARTLSDDEKARMQRRGQLLVSQSQRKQDDLNESVNVAQTEIMETIGAKLSDVVDKYGHDNNYSVILDMSAQGSPVIYNAMQMDITDEIVRLYDQAHPLKAGGAPASGLAPSTATPGQPARPAAPPAAAAPGRGATPGATAPGRGATGPGR